MVKRTNVDSTGAVGNLFFITPNTRIYASLFVNVCKHLKINNNNIWYW